MITSVNDFVAVSGVGSLVSVTVTVNVNEPNTVGVPEMTPVSTSRLNPGGSDPELIDQPYDG